MATPKLDIKHIDLRVADRYVRKGVLADKDFKQHLKDLPDLEGQYEAIAIPEAGAEEDDELEDEQA